MPCLHPITIKNKRYQKMTKAELQDYMINRIGLANCIAFQKNTYSRNGVSLPHYQYYPPDYELKVPCGKCAECQKNKRLQWSIRLIVETRQYNHNTFITLTLAPKYYKWAFKNPKEPLKLYIDRLRKRIGFRPKYFIVPEIGQDQNYTQRLHYHGIIFGTDEDKIPYKVLRDCWTYGISDTGFCEDKTCNYVVKYILKDYGKDGIKFKPFVFCSNGIGKAYLDNPNISKWHINNFDFRDYINFNGTLYPLPVYYKNHIYNDDVKLVKMLNKIYDSGPFEVKFNGITYTDKSCYNDAINRFYDWTLNHDLSKPVKFKDYGKLCISESGASEDFALKPRFIAVQSSLFECRPPLPYFGDGCSSR